MERDSFVFYRSFKNAVCALPESMRLQMLMAILDYALDGKEPPPDGVERAVLELIRPQLEANNKRYENGKKGGAPKGNNNAAKGKKTTKNNQKQPNVNVNDNVNENDTALAVSNARTRARESFCATYGIAANAAPPPDMDFDKLSAAYSQSKFLQDPNKPHFHNMRWIVKHYAEIVSGKYADFADKTAKPVAQGITNGNQAKGQAADLFTVISED